MSARSPIEDDAADALRAIAGAARLRDPLHLAGDAGPYVTIGERRLLHLCSNNYLGLAGDPRVVDAAARALRAHGAGSGGSRLVSGGTTTHRALEERLAQWKGAEDAVGFSSGYLANLGAITALAGPGDEVFSDALNHASVVDGCRLSGATIRVYRHADVTHLASLLASSSARRKLVVTESIFSMEGDAAPLRRIAGECERFGATLIVDEAHATGLLGPDGSGGVADAGLKGRVPVIVGTLSKALGSAGGFVCASRAVVSLLRNRARSFIFDTAPPASTAAAALAAVEIAVAEPERRERVLALARRLAAGLRDTGFDVSEPAAAIVPVVLGDERRAVRFAAVLRDRDILALPIRPPSVPDGTCRIRLTTMAGHRETDIDAAVAAFAAAAEAEATGARPSVP